MSGFSSFDEEYDDEDDGVLDGVAYGVGNGLFGSGAIDEYILWLLKRW